MNRCDQWVFGWLILACLATSPASAQSDSEGGEMTGQPGGGQSPYLSFCQERFYDEDDGIIYCNWSVNFHYACLAPYPSRIPRQAGSLISKPEVVGECDNGEPIIKILHY
ncbi:hypothetical protein [Microbulbifer sp. HZ11]|uniref:hypothetical protein n=1 Tax=unclassified Microbulbifer TaxID=2619833 RepID=UPI0005BE1DD2|nr:hypothetical protein [Microbulbifer sp. HZ11]